MEWRWLSSQVRKNRRGARSKSAEPCKIIRASNCGWEFIVVRSIESQTLTTRRTLPARESMSPSGCWTAADAGHILLSAHMAEDLAEVGHWRAYLHDLGECEVKHGLRLHLFNLYKDDLGNPQVPEKLRRRRRRQASDVFRPVISTPWTKMFVIVVLLGSAIALLIGSLLLLHRAPLSGIAPANRRKPAPGPAFPKRASPFFHSKI